MMFFLSLILPIFLGISISYACCHNKRLSTDQLLFFFALSVGLGLGLGSSFFFLWISILKQPQARYAYFEMVLFALALLLTWHIRRQKKTKGNAPPPFIGIYVPAIPRVISLSFYFLCGSSLMSFIFISLGNLHGRWDAWAIWNLRARFLFRAGTNWTDAFTDLLQWSHPDYPLLLPGLVAKCWAFIGSETVLVPILISSIFTFTTLLLLFSSLSILRGKNYAFLAGIGLLASFQFIRFGASQCADIPLSFFILACIALFALYDFQNEPNKNLVILAGAMVGMALWTKNEGILFLIAVLTGRIVAAMRTNRFRTYLQEMFSFGIGLLPFLAVCAFFKLTYAASSDFFAAENIDRLPATLGDWPRYTQVAKLYLSKLIRFENGLLVLAFLFLVLIGVDKFGEKKSKVFASLITLWVMYGGYYFVFILSPYDVRWHINTALNRLLLQLWPATLFLFFFLTRWNFPSKRSEKREENFNK
jgi:hypothetical protein